jgi:hypothetical protein
MAFYVVWDAEITNRPGMEPAEPKNWKPQGSRSLGRVGRSVSGGGPVQLVR